MGPNQPNIETNPASTSEPKNIIFDNSSKPKKPKALIATTVILAILTIAGIGASIYFFMDANNKATDNSNLRAQIALLETEPTTEPTAEPTTEGEIDITNTYVLRDLDEKMAILHLSSTTEPTIVKRFGTHPELPLYSDGVLSEAAKVPHVANFLPDREHYLTTDEKESIISALGYSGIEAENIRNSSLYGIDGNIVIKKYLDVFGEKLVPESSISFNYCPYYAYNATYDFYYIDPNGGCGGTSPYINYYYKNAYTTDGDHAYVYVSAATLNAEDSNIYCDVIPFNSDEKPEVCGTFSDDDTFVLDSSNYKDFAQYRFVFNKADDGTYYFEKVEKL